MSVKSSISDSYRFGRSSLGFPTCLLVSLLTLLVAAGVQALERGSKPPRIDLPDRTGVTVNLDQLIGKVVLVDFWASWCRPCKEEMPALQRLHLKYREQGLVVVGVNIDRSKRKMNRFLEEVPVSFRIVHDKGLEVANRYAPPRMPSSYLIGRGGRLEHVHSGFRPKDIELIDTRVKALLAQSVAR